jgi:hypothetical protein
MWTSLLLPAQSSYGTNVLFLMRSKAKWLRLAQEAKIAIFVHIHFRLPSVMDEVTGHVNLDSGVSSIEST